MGAYKFPFSLLGVTVHYYELSDGTSNYHVEYHLTEEEYRSQPFPGNVNSYKAKMANVLGITLQEYEARVAREVAQAPYSAKGERMESNRTRLIGEFRAYNGGVIARGEATVEQVRAFRKSEEADEILDSLRALDFDDAVSLIQAWEHPLATEEFKDYWTAKIEGAM